MGLGCSGAGCGLEAVGVSAVIIGVHNNGQRGVKSSVNWEDMRRNREK